jgi:hypothetical protein
MNREQEKELEQIAKLYATGAAQQIAKLYATGAARNSPVTSALLSGPTIPSSPRGIMYRAAVEAHREDIARAFINGYAACVEAGRIREECDATMLADKLLHDLNDRSGFSLDAESREMIRRDWIKLITEAFATIKGDDILATIDGSAETARTT